MTELPTFSEFKGQYKWIKLISNKKRTEIAKGVLSELQSKGAVKKNPLNMTIADAIATSIKPVENLKDKKWGDVARQVNKYLNKYRFYEVVGPDEVDKKGIEDNNYIAFNPKDVISFHVEKAEREPLKNNFKLEDMISDYNAKEPKIETPEQQQSQENREKREKRSKEKEFIDNLGKKINAKSIDEQIKNTITKIAKSKELMNLSNEQLRDFLAEAYEISDENALNNMMNAVVAKRAELLANKQLKHEELTELDIGNLQEQAQRDFEKKLQNQNLRYILPAQIEKRERLVQNRLNPELLKSGY